MQWGKVCNMIVQLQFLFTENRLPYVGITRTGSKDYFDLPEKFMAKFEILSPPALPAFNNSYWNNPTLSSNKFKAQP